MKTLTLLIVLLSSFTVVFAKGEDYTSYKITFNIDGELLEFDVKSGDTVGSIKKPVKEGYDFVGWFKNGVLYDFSLPVTEDIELVARFTLITTETVNEEPKQTSNQLIAPVLIGSIIATATIIYLVRKKLQTEI